MTSLRIGVAALLCAAGGMAVHTEDGLASGAASGQVVTSASVVASDTHGAMQVVVVMQHARGVHTWPDHVIDMPELPGFRPYMTRIDVIELGTSTTAGPVVWPEPHDVPTISDGRRVVLKAFSGAIRAAVPLTTVDRRRMHGRLVVRYQPCSDRLCYRPQADTLSF